MFLRPGADPEIFERGGPEAIIYKILERGGPKSVKMAFECLFQSFSYKFFANTPPKGGAQAPWAPPLNPPLPTRPDFVVACWEISHTSQLLSATKNQLVCDELIKSPDFLFAGTGPLPTTPM